MKVQVCFVCLKKVKGESEVGGGRETEKYPGLEQIFSKFVREYLEVKTVGIDNWFGRGTRGDQDERQPCYCEECEVVLSSICGLYLELLGTQLRLSWKLGELRKLLESSKATVSNKLGNLLINSLAKQLSADRKVVDNTRSLMIRKCAEKGKENLPNVPLFRGRSGQDINEGWRREIIKVEREEEDEDSDDDDDDDDEASTYLFNKTSQSSHEADVKMEVESLGSSSGGGDDDLSNEMKEEEFLSDFDCELLLNKPDGVHHEGKGGFKNEVLFDPQIPSSDFRGTELNEYVEVSTKPSPVRRRKKAPAAKNPKSKATGKKRGPKPKPKKVQPIPKLDLEGWICSLCKEPAQDLTTHIACHKYKTISYGNPCCFCWRSYNECRTLEAHIVNGHKTVGSDGAYSCDAEGCPLSFSSLEELNTHAKTHQESLRYCKTCGLGCLSVNHLKLHKIRHIRPLQMLSTKKDVAKRKGSQLLYPCSKCDQIFNKFLLLHDHFCQSHCSGTVPSFKCPKCGLSARTKQLHRCGNGRGKKRREIMTCCNTTFKHLYQFHAHRRDFHNPIKCSRCGETVAGLFAKKEHDAGRDLTCVVLHPCKICGNSYRSPSYLATHIRTVHVDASFNCPDPDCDKSFKTPSRLKSHISVVHNTVERPKPHFCPYCDKSFATPQYLSKHKALVHSSKNPERQKRYQCPSCKDWFSRKEVLESHILKCDPVKAAALMVTCKICGRPIKGGRNKLMMDKHVITHMSAEEKEKFGKKAEVHLCDTCGKEFTSKQNMERHAVVHLEMKEFLCEQCPKAYHSKFILENHVRNVHSKTKKLAKNAG